LDIVSVSTTIAVVFLKFNEQEQLFAMSNTLNLMNGLKAFHKFPVKLLMHPSWVKLIEVSSLNQFDPRRVHGAPELAMCINCTDACSHACTYLMILSARPLFHS
jgi:hypothetical protein